MRIAAAAHKVAAERSFGARKRAAHIGAAGHLEAGVGPGIELGAATVAANIAVDIAAAEHLGYGVARIAIDTAAAERAAHSHFEVGFARQGEHPRAAHPRAGSGSGTVWQFGQMWRQGTTAGHLHALQTRPRGLKALRRKSIVLRRFFVARKACGKSLGEPFDSGGGKAAIRTKRADSFPDSLSLSVDSKPCDCLIP